MAASFTLYRKFRKYAYDGTIDLKTDSIRLMLVTADYVPSIGHNVLQDVKASPSYEVPQTKDSGYRLGGAYLTGRTIKKTTPPFCRSFMANPVTWPYLTAIFRYGILYAEKSIGSIVNPLIGFIIFDTSPDDVRLTRKRFVVRWAPEGIISHLRPWKLIQR